jgi:hypothetical protein
MEQKELERQLTDAKSHLKQRDDLTAFHGESQPFEGFVFMDVALVEFIDQAVDRVSTSATSSRVGLRRTTSISAGCATSTRGGHTLDT